MTIEIVNGCLIDAFDRGEVNVMVQCVNCQGVMGGGLAKAIREKYPFVYTEYRKFYEEGKDSHYGLLGFIQNIDLAMYDYRHGTNWSKNEDYKLPDKHIVNVFGQEFYGTGKRQVNYGALGQAFTAMAYGLTQASEDAFQEDYDVIGFPYLFGCGLAGGDWDTVLEMIQFHFRKFNVRIYKL